MSSGAPRPSSAPSSSEPMPLPALRSRSTLGRLCRLTLQESPPSLPFLLGQPPLAASPKPCGVLRADAPGSSAPSGCGVARADVHPGAAPGGPAGGSGGSGVERADDCPEPTANRALACQAALGACDSASGIGAASSAPAAAPAGAAPSAPAAAPAPAAKALAAGACGGGRVAETAGSPGRVGVAGADALLAGGRTRSSPWRPPARSPARGRGRSACASTADGVSKTRIPCSSVSGEALG